MNNISFLNLSADNWQTYKNLRLQSLQDAPDAFGSTLEREAEFSDDEWISRLVFEGKSKLPIIALVNDEPIGLAFGVLHYPTDDTAFIYQMWVNPKVRGLGISRLMINNLVDWAKSLNVGYLSLEVTTNNLAAINLYKTSGFEAFGSLEKLRESSSLYTQAMRKPLK